MEDHEQTELLRQKLLDEAYAGVVSGLGAMLLDAEEIRQAGPDELSVIAKRWGIQ